MHFSKLVALTAATLAVAHPGEKHDPYAVKREVRARDAMANHAKRSLDACASSDPARQLQQRNIARRARTARELRHARGITARQCHHPPFHPMMQD